MVGLNLLLVLVFGLNLQAQTFGRLGPHGVHGAELSDPNHWMAIVGDSGVTGAASSPGIEPTLTNLAGHLANFITESRDESRLPALSGFPDPERFHIEKITALTRVPYARSEFKSAGGPLGVLALNLGAKLSFRVDVHEHAFGYMVGRALGMVAQDIVLVGQDGVRVETIATQLERIYEMKTTTLPPLLFISYTANDFCDLHVFDRSVGEWAGQFKEALEKTWGDAKPFLKAHPNGSKVFILAPFDVVNVITNPAILAQKVNVEGQGEITCGQLRHGETHLNISSWLVLRMLNLMCPSVTGTHPGDEFRLTRLTDVQAAFGEVWKAQIEALNARYEAKGLTFTYLDGVRNLSFTTGDIGNDCFHPSVRGHAKIADWLLSLGLLK